jgi:hypothetical protein
VKFIIAIALLFVLAVAAMMLLRGSGPRITEIDRRREIDEDEDRR